MKKFNIYIKLCSLLAIALLSMCVLSCEKEEPESTETRLLSFGPAGVMHGENIVVIGENLLAVDAVEFAPDIMVPKANFVSHDDMEIHLMVPLSAESGKIKLHTAAGIIESLTVINFDVLFTIESFTPEARPESDITITGELLNWVETITFNKDLTVEAAEFVSQTQNEIVVTVPKEAKTGPLVFGGGGTDPAEIETDELIVTLPAISSISPLDLRHADQLTINGTNLDLTKEVVFPDGTLVSDFVSVSESSLVVDVPVTAVDGVITLTTYSDLEVVSAESISIILPQETSLTPSPVMIGEELTIAGVNLDLVQSLIFPGSITPFSDFVSQSDSEIKIIVPDGAASGFMKFITIHDFVVNMTVELELPGSGPTPLSYTIFGDDFDNGWGNWGWVGAESPSTEEVFDGSASIKLLFNSAGGAWEGIQMGNGAPLDVSLYTNLVFYAYGAAGSNDGEIMVKINSADNNPTNITIVEGVWTEYSLPISDLNANSGTDNSWGMLVLQEFDQLGGDVYVDFVGFR